MTDQSQRLEVATVKAEVGSNILYRFANDSAASAEIPTESGDIPNLKQVILQLQEDGAEKISFATTIYPTTAAGIAATTDGAVFLVVSNEADEIYAVYTNTAGVAVDTGKRALSSQAVQDAMQAATEAAEAAQDAADISTERTARFLAPVSTPPVIRDDGTPLQIGDRYVNTVDQAEYIYKTEGWALNDSLVAVEALKDSIISSDSIADLVDADSVSSVKDGFFRQFSALTLWNYIKVKVSALLGLRGADFSDYPGIDMTGVTDSTVALQAALSSGVKRFTGKGTVKFTSKLNIPIGVIIEGNDQLRLLYSGPEDGDAIEFVDATSGFKHLSGLPRCILITSVPGRYGVTTPKSANAWNRQYRFDFTGFQAYDVDESLTVATNYWQRALNLGDFRRCTIRRYHIIGGWPQTDTNGTDHNCTGIYVSSNTGAIGLTINDGDCTSCSHPINLGDGVEGHYITGNEAVSCWEGLTYSNSNPEPGGFVDGNHWNASKACVVGSKRVEIQFGQNSGYRSSGMAVHSEGWSGIDLTDCNFKVTIGNFHIVPGSALALMNSWAYRFKNCAFAFCHIKGFDISLQMTGALLLDNVTGVRADNVTARGCETFCEIVNSASDIFIDNVDASNTDATLLKVPSGFNPTRVYIGRRKQGSLNSPASLSVNASSDFTIQPKSGQTTVSTSGTVTANLILSKVGASAGDIVEIKYVNSATAGTTVTILNGAAGTTLNIIRSGNSNRYIIRYRFNGTNWSCDYLALDLDATLRT